MASALRLSLTFEPLEEMWPQHPAELLLDLQALYFAAHDANRQQQVLSPLYREELRALLTEAASRRRTWSDGRSIWNEPRPSQGSWR